GKITLNKNYSTGKQSPETKELPAELAKLIELKKNADQVVSNAFGKNFFNKSITINFDRSGYHRTRERYDKDVPSHHSSTKWFFYPEKEIQYVDFVYNIKLSEFDYYPTIIVRMDRSGSVMKDLIKTYKGHINSTLGLVAKPMGKVLSKDAAVKLAVSEGLPGSETPLVELIWEPDQAGSSYGSYYYRLLFDKLSRTGPGFENIYFREWLVNVTTKQVTKDREYVTGEASVEEAPINRDQRDGKYGISNQSENRILIPYEYDELPYRYEAFMIAQKGGKMGAINFKNETRIPFIFDNVYFINAGKLKRYENRYLLVEKDTFIGLYNIDGEELLPAIFTKIEKGENEQIVG
ncbi:MAG: hypothetical protein C0490_28200, partial [Marivirga sp.]|nr:hypothetical protein [Marivirga sp.]